MVLLGCSEWVEYVSSRRTSKSHRVRGSQRMRKIIRDRMILTETQTETENERVKQSKREMHRHPETRVYKKWSGKKNIK